MSQGAWQKHHLFPLVLQDMLTNSAYRQRGILPLKQINTGSFSDAASFCLARKYFCDIALADPINRREWGSQAAENNLLQLVVRNGEFALEPIFYGLPGGHPFSGKEPVTGMFTAGNIVEDSFEARTPDVADLQPVRVSVRWRQERQSNTLNDKGIFPVIREVTVSKSDAPGNAEQIRIDLSDYCTSQQHAIDVAKYNCLKPEYQNLIVRFRTFPQAGMLLPGRCFLMALETLSYERPQNGVIASDGSVTAWPPLPDKTYQVLLWQSGQGAPTEQSLTISNGRAGPPRSVFCLASQKQDTICCKALRVELNEDGEVEVEAISHPIDDNGFSLYSIGFDDPGNWIIEGAI